MREERATWWQSQDLTGAENGRFQGGGHPCPDLGPQGMVVTNVTKPAGEEKGGGKVRGAALG